MTDQPKDPMTPLTESAHQMHEFYISLLDAGFDRKQAIYLVGQAIAGASAQSAAQ